METFEPKIQKDPSGTLATAALVTGILGLLSILIPPLQFILGVVTIVLVIFSRRDKPMTARAGAGLALGIQSIIVSILMVLYVAAVLNFLKANPQYSHMFQSLLNN